MPAQVKAIIEYNLLVRYIRFVRRARCVSAFAATAVRRLKRNPLGARDVPTAAEQRVESAELGYAVRAGSRW